jgi:hypothetical protein
MTDLWRNYRQEDSQEHSLELSLLKYCSNINLCSGNESILWSPKEKGNVNEVTIVYGFRFLNRILEGRIRVIPRGKTQGPEPSRSQDLWLPFFLDHSSSNRKYG